VNERIPLEGVVLVHSSYCQSKLEKIIFSFIGSFMVMSVNGGDAALLLAAARWYGLSVGSCSFVINMSLDLSSCLAASKKLGYSTWVHV